MGMGERDRAQSIGLRLRLRLRLRLGLGPPSQVLSPDARIGIANNTLAGGTRNVTAVFR